MARSKLPVCPHCRSAMSPAFTRGPGASAPVALSHCRSCWGVFLPRRALTELGIAEDVAAARALDAEPSSRRCPECERMLDAVECRARLNPLERVELDRCPACAGVFFDPDEVAALTGRPASVTADPSDEYLVSDPERAESARPVDTTYSLRPRSRSRDETVAYLGDFVGALWRKLRARD